VNKHPSRINLLGIKGFLETSFLDWDGKVSCVLFLPGCNFRCPFCQNWQIVEEPERIADIDWEIIEGYLKKQKGWIDGVVITGGEPTIYPHLIDLLERVKELGQMVKLDTNGYNPQLLKELCEGGFVDYIAMDVKAPLDERYETASGIKGLDLKRIRTSIGFLLSKDGDYEFRTTLVPSIIRDEEIEDIGRIIEGASRWVLQDYQPEAAKEDAFRHLKPYRKEEVERFLSIARKYVKTASYRGKWR
jgi:pyruvate formate lyase activating enzyme